VKKIAIFPGSFDSEYTALDIYDICSHLRSLWDFDEVNKSAWFIINQEKSVLRHRHDGPVKYDEVYQDMDRVKSDCCITNSPHPRPLAKRHGNFLVRGTPKYD